MILFFMPAVVFSQDILLIVRPEGEAFKEVVTGIKEELEEEVTIAELIIDLKSTVITLSEKLKEVKPKLLVLMDNKSVNLYKKLQKGLPDSAVTIPSVACMAFFLDKTLEKVKNISGITYEIPVITSITNLCSILDIKVDKVGIIHRKFAREYIKKNKEYCRQEKIDLINIELSQKMIKKTEIKKSLKKLFKNEGVDALFVLNDNALLKSDILRDVWIPLEKKYKVPVVVGVEILADPKINLATLAVLPDHVNLGSQVAEMIFNIVDNNWQIDEPQIDPPLSVIKVVNVKKAKKHYGVKEENLVTVDKLLH